MLKYFKHAYEIYIIYKNTFKRREISVGKFLYEKNGLEGPVDHSYL